MERSTPRYFTTRLRPKGQITLPKGVRDLLNIEPGDGLIFIVNKNCQIVIEQQKVIPPHQAWFWSERWQEMEQKAQEDIDTGAVHQFENVDDAISALQELANASDSND